jgi:hypothetical protein
LLLIATMRGDKQREEWLQQMQPSLYDFENAQPFQTAEMVK